MTLPQARAILALLYNCEGSIPRAEPLYKMAIEIREKKSGTRNIRMSCKLLKFMRPCFVREGRKKDEARKISESTGRRHRRIRRRGLRRRS